MLVNGELSRVLYDLDLEGAPLGVIVPPDLPIPLPKLSTFTLPEFDIWAPSFNTVDDVSVQGQVTCLRLAANPDDNVCAAIEAVDPTPDLIQVPTYGVTSDVERLATGGRSVQGVSADGVAQVLIRVPTSGPGEQLEFKIQESGAPTKLGSLGQIGSNPCGSGATDIPVVSQALASGQSEAFALYCAPLDYASFAADPDSQTATRLLHIQVTSTSGSSPDQNLELKVVRPKVVFIHGFNSDAPSWNPMRSQLPDYLQLPFAVDAVEYGYKVGYPSTDPPLPSLAFSAVKHSQVGVVSNASVTMSQITNWLKDYRMGSNPASVPIASAQVDVVGHSMGGLVARTLPVAADTKSRYFSVTNYNKGLLHKLITLGTPHLGTPQAISQLASVNYCSSLLAALAGTYSFYSVNGESGAVNDLVGDGTGRILSDALEQLSSDMPIAYGAGDVGTQLESLNDLNPMYLVRAVCGSHTVLPDGTFTLGLQPGFDHVYYYGEPTADRWTPERWKTQFDPNVLLNAPSKEGTTILPVDTYASSVPVDDDASVPVNSALNRIDPGNPYVTVFPNTVHSPGWTDLGFRGDNGNLQTSAQVANWITSLLNAPLSDPRFHR